MNAHVIRAIGVIVGGAIGGIVSGQISDYLNPKPKSNSTPNSNSNPNSNPNQNDNLKYNSFEDMIQKKYNLELEHQKISKSNSETSIDALYQLYSNDKSNELDTNASTEIKFINDSIYDGNFYDYYTLITTK